MARRRRRGALAACAAWAAWAVWAAEPQVVVVNKGFSGRNTAQALRLLEQEVLPLRPQHVVLNFGMNDAMNSGNLLPLDVYEANLRALAARLAAGGVRTVALVTLNPVIVSYVAARHPRHPQRERLQEHLARYDRVVRALAREQGLPLVDLRALVEAQGGAVDAETSLLRCERNGGGRDGVHLTPAAYARLGRLVFETLDGRVKAGETVVCFGDSLTYGASVKGAGTAGGETYPAALQRAFDERAGEADRQR